MRLRPIWGESCGDEGTNCPSQQSSQIISLDTFSASSLQLIEMLKYMADKSMIKKGEERCFPHF